MLAEGGRNVSPSNHVNTKPNTCVAALVYLQDNLVTAMVLDAHENRLLARFDSVGDIKGGVLCLRACRRAEIAKRIL